MEKSTMEPSRASPTLKNEEEQIHSTKSKMGEVREENKRLRTNIDRIVKDYHTLQMHFNDILQKDTNNSCDDQIMEKAELVSLSLGGMPLSSDDCKKGMENGNSFSMKKEVEECLCLGLNCKFEASTSSPTRSSHIRRPHINVPYEPGEEAGQDENPPPPPSKFLKRTATGEQANDISQQRYDNKKPRVSVRARCDTSTMNDGCHWRKYGQKIAKGNPCPRAYYRCTIAPSCPVRKQVQRSAEDMSVLISTYEGTHNHPLPIGATAMASTTSAAASMLMSGVAATASSTSHPPANFYPSNSNHFSIAAATQPSLFSSSASHPTITLDLTTATASTSRFNAGDSTIHPLRHDNSAPTPTCLNFASANESNAHPVSWIGSFLSSSESNGAAAPEATAQQVPLLQDSIEAATKAITADPSFQSALAAALASIIGSKGGERFGWNGTTWGNDAFPRIESSSSQRSSGSGGSLGMFQPTSSPDNK